MTDRCKELDKMYKGLKEMDAKISVKKNLLGTIKAFSPECVHDFDKQLSDMEKRKEQMEYQMMKDFSSLGNDKVMRVMKGHYIDFLGWDELANNMGISTRYAMILRNKGLAMLDEGGDVGGALKKILVHSERI